MSDDPKAEPPGTTSEKFLIDRVAELLPGRIEPTWFKLYFEFRAAADYSEGRLHVHEESGESRTKRFPHAIFDIASELRDLMYRPEAGTWLSAAWEVTTREDGAHYSSAEFDYHKEPTWSHPVSPYLYRHDLEDYPRHRDQIPDWLTAILRETE